MQSSALAALATPDLTSLGLLYEVIADIRRLDTPAVTDRAFRHGVLGAIAERLPPPPGALHAEPGRLAPGSTAADAAGMISGALAWHDGPATPLLTRLAQAPVTIDVTRAAHRALTPAEAASLDAAPGDRAYEREGTLTAGDVTVAAARLLLIRARIPAGAFEAIQDGQPAGDALAPYGMRRTRRKVTLDRAAATLDAAATLMLGDLPAGTAREHVTPQFCAHVARLAG